MTDVPAFTSSESASSTGSAAACGHSRCLPPAVSPNGRLYAHFVLCLLAQALVQLQPGMDELRSQRASRDALSSHFSNSRLTLSACCLCGLLADSRDTSSLISWVRSRAECHILHHEQLVLYHSQQLSQWTALKQAVDSASSPASSPLSPLRSSPLKKGKGADSVREEVRRRFGSVMAGWKWEEKSRKKDRKAGKENAAVSARDMERRITGGGGSAAVASEAAVTKTPDSRGVKFAAQAVVIGEGEVPVVDDRRRKDASADKQRAKTQQRDDDDDDDAAKEQKEQLQQQQEDSILSSPAAKEAPASPKLVLPSLSGLLAERDDDGTTAADHLHDSAPQPPASSTAVTLPAAPPAPAPAVNAASSSAARLSPFLQFHPSLREHPYHQQLIQTPPPPPPSIAPPSARAPAPPAPSLPAPPPPPPSLPPKKKLEAFIPASPPPLQPSVSTVRFRVDAEMPMTAADDSTTVLLHTSSGLMSPPAAAAAAAAAQVMSPPPLPPRRPAAALLSPPQSAGRAPPSGAFCYLTPSQLAVNSGSGAAGSRHRRQRSKSVDLTAARSG